MRAVRVWWACAAPCIAGTSNMTGWHQRGWLQTPNSAAASAAAATARRHDHSPSSSSSSSSRRQPCPR